MPREMQRFSKQIIQPRLLLPGHVFTAGDGIDDRLMEEIGDHDPQRGRPGRVGKGPDDVVQRHRQIIVGRSAAVVDHLDDQRAGVDHHIDQHEQPREQQHRTKPVRCDVRVKTVGGHDGLPLTTVIPGHANGVNPESGDSWVRRDSGLVASRRPGMTE